MRRMLMVSPVLFVFALGCSQTNTKWTEDDFRAFLPQMESVAQVLTQQALTGKPDNVRVAVNTVAKDVAATLSGTYVVDQAKIDQMVEQAFAKISNVPQIVKPIVKSILLVGLQSAEAKINEIGLSLSAKNALIVDFVKATATGIQKGSAVPPTAAGQFVLPMENK